MFIGNPAHNCNIAIIDQRMTMKRRKNISIQDASKVIINTKNNASLQNFRELAVLNFIHKIQFFFSENEDDGCGGQ